MIDPERLIPSAPPFRVDRIARKAELNINLAGTSVTVQSDPKRSANLGPEVFARLQGVYSRLPMASTAALSQPVRAAEATAVTKPVSAEQLRIFHYACAFS